MAGMTTAADTTTTNVATVQAIYDAFGRGDVASILERLDPDVVWDHDTPSYGVPIYEPRTGRAEVPAFFEALGQHANLYKFEPTNILTGGDQVAVVVQIGVEINGRRIEEIEIHLWTFGASGLITRFAHVLDRHATVAAWRGVEP